MEEEEITTEFDEAAEGEMEAVDSVMGECVEPEYEDTEEAE